MFRGGEEGARGGRAAAMRQWGNGAMGHRRCVRRKWRRTKDHVEDLRTVEGDTVQVYVEEEPTHACTQQRVTDGRDRHRHL